MSAERTHVVYEAFDADGLLLYVGCTGNFEKRRASHMRGNDGDGRGWFESFVTDWRVSGPYPKATALRIEREKIAAQHPIWNGDSEQNRRDDRSLIAEYLRFHGVKFQRNPNRTRPDLVLVGRKRSRRLRAVTA